MSHEYENLRRVTYGDEADDCGLMVFVPVCVRCGRFVKADKAVRPKDAQEDRPTATCKKHGRVAMHFEGFF